MNVVVLIGRLTRDPELRYIPETQNAVCTFTLAVDRPMSREKQADFIRITVFGRQAENCAKFITKGRQVAVEGRIQTGSYQNKNGRYRLYDGCHCKPGGIPQRRRRQQRRRFRLWWKLRRRKLRKSAVRDGKFCIISTVIRAEFRTVRHPGGF